MNATNSFYENSTFELNKILIETEIKAEVQH